jgi:hypothetical protein
LPLAGNSISFQLPQRTEVLAECGFSPRKPVSENPGFSETGNLGKNDQCFLLEANTHGVRAKPISAEPERKSMSVFLRAILRFPSHKDGKFPRK